MAMMQVCHSAAQGQLSESFRAHSGREESLRADHPCRGTSRRPSWNLREIGKQSLYLLKSIINYWKYMLVPIRVAAPVIPSYIALSIFLERGPSPG